MTQTALPAKELTKLTESDQHKLMAMDAPALKDLHMKLTADMAADGSTAAIDSVAAAMSRVSDNLPRKRQAVKEKQR